MKSRTDVIDEPTLARFTAELRNLSSPHVHNLLIRLFGIFTSPATDQILRKNVAKLAPAVWQYAQDGVKYKIGSMIDGYRTNLEKERLSRGGEFLALVDGRMYETLPARLVALSHLADQLAEKHNGWDNFHNEPPVIREILAYCRTSTDIPKEILPKLTKVVIRCRLGRGLSYRDGVSPAGLKFYDRFLGMLDDDGITQALAALFDPAINSKLTNPICQKHLLAILQIFSKLAISDRLRDIIKYLLNDIPGAWNAGSKKAFRDLASPFLTWS